MLKRFALTRGAALLLAGSFGLASGPSASADEIVQSPDGNGYIVYWGETPGDNPGNTGMMGVEVAGETVSSSDVVVPSPDGNGYIVYWGDDPSGASPTASTPTTESGTSMPEGGGSDSGNEPVDVDEFGDDTVMFDEPSDEPVFSDDVDVVVEPTMTDEVDVAGVTVVEDDTVGVSEDDSTAPIEAPAGDYRDENGFGYVIEEDVVDEDTLEQ